MDAESEIALDLPETTPAHHWYAVVLALRCTLPHLPNSTDTVRPTRAPLVGVKLRRHLADHNFRPSKVNSSTQLRHHCSHGSRLRSEVTRNSRANQRSSASGRDQESCARNKAPKQRHGIFDWCNRFVSTYVKGGDSYLYLGIIYRSSEITQSKRHNQQLTHSTAFQFLDKRR